MVRHVVATVASVDRGMCPIARETLKMRVLLADDTNVMVCPAD